MRTREWKIENERWLRSLLLMVSAFSFQLSAFSQSYSIDWSTVDGGGGTSTGGVYAVTGTIGQPDAGAMSGGDYTLQGGFWSVISVVQTPGAPYLTVVRSNNVVTVSWPSPSTGWNLQQNTDLNTAHWTTPPETITDDGTRKFITVSPPVGNRFYRLHQP